MCFICDRKPRVPGDVACRSCLQEHRKCYECGENDRNFPFKLCSSCYAAHTAQASGLGIVAVPAVQPPLRSGAGNVDHVYEVCWTLLAICCRSDPFERGPTDVQGSE